MFKSRGKLDAILLPLTFAYLAAGVGAWFVGYGVKPLLVALGTIPVLGKVMGNLEERGSPAPGMKIYQPDA